MLFFVTSFRTKLNKLLAKRNKINQNKSKQNKTGQIDFAILALEGLSVFVESSETLVKRIQEILTVKVIEDKKDKDGNAMIEDYTEYSKKHLIPLLHVFQPLVRD